MPVVNAKWIEPDVAHQQGLCPECGEPIEEARRAKHSRSHWPDELPSIPENSEAQRRKNLLEKAPRGGKS